MPLWTRGEIIRMMPAYWRCLRGRADQQLGSIYAATNKNKKQRVCAAWIFGEFLGYFKRTLSLSASSLFSSHRPRPTNIEAKEHEVDASYSNRIRSSPSNRANFSASLSSLTTSPSSPSNHDVETRHRQTECQHINNNNTKLQRTK